MSRRSSLAWMEEVGLPSIDTDTTESDAPISDNDVVLTEQEIVNDIEETSAELRYMTKMIRRSEYIADRYVYLFHLCDHVSTYGVDKSFVGLADWNGVLSRDLCIRYPNLTSIPSVGSPTSPLSRATIAGLEGAIGGFFKWIGDLFKKFWNWLCGLFGGGKKDSGAGKAESANEKTEAVLDGIDKDLENVELGSNEEVLKAVWDEFIAKHGNDEVIAFKKLPVYLSKLSAGLSCAVKIIPHFKAGAEMLKNISDIVDETGKEEEIANKIHAAAKTFKDQHQQEMINIANQAKSLAEDLHKLVTEEKKKLQDQPDLCSNMRLASRFVAQLREANEKMKDLIDNSIKVGKEYESTSKEFEDGCDNFMKKVQNQQESIAKLKAAGQELKDLKTYVFEAGKKLAIVIQNQMLLQEGIFKLAAQVKLLVSTKAS